MKTAQWFKENLKDQNRPVSSSSTIDGLRCERLYFFRSRWAIRPKVTQHSAGATTGSLAHRLLKAGRDRAEKVHQQVIKQHAELVDRIRAGEDLNGELTKAANDLNHLYQKALAMCNIFWDKFPPKEYMTTICREERKEAFLPNSTLPAVWIADWVVRDERDGSVWIRDAKTTSEGLDSVLTGFLYSVPCRFYRLMAAQEEWGNKVRGMILDIMLVPTIKLCGKDEKTAAKLGCTPFEAYVQRVKEWYEVQSKIDEPMKSLAIVFNEDIHNPEIMNALAKMTDLTEREPQPENFDRDLTRSRCFYNRKPCPYYMLCSSDPDGWPSLIEKYYEVREEPGRKENEDEEGNEDVGTDSDSGN